MIDPNKHRPIRLKDYDYTKTGAYFGRPEPEEQPQGVAPTEDHTALSLPDVVQRFKTLTTKRYVDGVKQFRWKPFAGRLWQRNYFEHMIRSEDSLCRIREYIVNNPAQWELDRENPLAMRPEPRDAWRMGS